MRQRIPAVLAITALVIAVLGRHVSSCLALATTRRVGLADKQEARFFNANTSGEQENIGFGGLDANAVAAIGHDGAGGQLVAPPPFKVFVFC